MPIANENSSVPRPVSRDNFNVYVTQPDPEMTTTNRNAVDLPVPVGSHMGTAEILRQIDRVSESINAANRASTSAFIVNADACNGTVNLNGRVDAVQIYVTKSGDKFEVKALGRTIIAEAPAEIPQAVFRLLEGSKLFE